ncbi:MAG TPA: hypothetical protein VGF79_11090 [Bacteroidia bacterium]
MEERKSRIRPEEKIRSLILKYSGQSNFKNDDCLEWDLGMVVYARLFEQESKVEVFILFQSMFLTEFHDTLVSPHL